MTPSEWSVALMCGFVAAVFAYQIYRHGVQPTLLPGYAKQQSFQLNRAQFTHDMFPWILSLDYLRRVPKCVVRNHVSGHINGLSFDGLDLSDPSSEGMPPVSVVRFALERNVPTVTLIELGSMSRWFANLTGAQLVPAGDGNRFSASAESSDAWFGFLDTADLRAIHALPSDLVCLEFFDQQVVFTFSRPLSPRVIEMSREATCVVRNALKVK